VWKGVYLENSDKQVLAGKYRIDKFSDSLRKEAERLFFGADFGFAKDPNTLVRSFVLHILGDYSDDAIGFMEPAYNAFVSLEMVEGGSG